MSKKKVYIARHQVRHNNLKVAPGKPIELTDEEAAPLLARKHIKASSDVVFVPAAVLGASTLSKFTKEELLAHGNAAGVVLDESANKEAILAAFAAHLDAISTKGFDPAKE